MFKVYWTNAAGEPNSEDVTTLNDALASTERLRKSGNRFVTMVSENPEHVGKPGVATVSDGKTPDGSDYTWSKQHRAGKSRKTDALITNQDY